MLIVYPESGEFQQVDVFYQINDGEELNHQMELRDGEYQWLVEDLNAGDVIDYYFAYISEGSEVPLFSEQQQVFFGDEVDRVELPENSETIANNTPNNDASIANSSIVKEDQRSSAPEFFNGGIDLIFPLEGKFELVDVHYRVNKGPQLDHRMDFWKGHYHRFIDGLSVGDIIDYYYTYIRTNDGATFSLEGGRFAVGEDLSDT